MLEQQQFYWENFNIYLFQNNLPVITQRIVWNWQKNNSSNEKYYGKTVQNQRQNENQILIESPNFAPFGFTSAFLQN